MGVGKGSFKLGKLFHIFQCCSPLGLKFLTFLPVLIADRARLSYFEFLGTFFCNIFEPKRLPLDLLVMMVVIFPVAFLSMDAV